MSDKKRVTIGRSFSSSRLEELSDEYTQTFILASGEKATFRLEKIAAEEVESKTFVTFENNGRDQAALTAASLNDILQTISLQQFYPAIGRRLPEGIEILDGSRRRASAIIAKVGFSVLVTDEQLEVSDARKLAADIQTAKEHNLREQGLRFLKMREAGLSQKTIAETENYSEAKVSRAIQAASVPQVLLELFPVQSELAFPDYKVLLTITENLKTKDIEPVVLVDAVLERLTAESEDHVIDKLAPDAAKDRILELFKSSALSVLNPPLKDKAVTKKLWEFDDKDRFARKKIKGRAFSYEFGRLSKELQAELDTVITDTLKKHLS